MQRQQYPPGGIENCRPMLNPNEMMFMQQHPPVIAHFDFTVPPPSYAYYRRPPPGPPGSTVPWKEEMEMRQSMMPIRPFSNTTVKAAENDDKNRKRTMDGTFYRGSATESSTKFTDKEKKLLREMKFEKQLETEVDLRKIDIDVIKPWITQKLTSLLAMEDDVVNEYVFSQLEEKQLNPKIMQINLTGFLNARRARQFMGELWELLIEAQNTPDGIPLSLVQKKIEELKAGDQKPDDSVAIDLKDTSSNWNNRYQSLTYGKYKPQVKEEVDDEDDRGRSSRHRSPSPKRSDRQFRHRRENSQERGRKRSNSPERRRKRSDSPERKRKRSESPERRRKRSESPERRRKRSDSPERRRKRSESPDRRRKRSESPERRRKRSDRDDDEKRRRREAKKEERSKRRGDDDEHRERRHKKDREHRRSKSPKHKKKKKDKSPRRKRSSSSES